MHILLPERVFDLQSRHEINGLWLSNITKGDNAKSKKGILVPDVSSGPVLHFCQVPSKYSKGYLSYRADTKSFSNKTKGDNSKSKNGRVVILVGNMSSGPVLHFYQVSSKYSKGYSYSSYRVDKKFYTDANADRRQLRPKNNMSLHPPPPSTCRGGHNNRDVLGDKIRLLIGTCSSLANIDSKMTMGLCTACKLQVYSSINRKKSEQKGKNNIMELSFTRHNPLSTCIKYSEDPPEKSRTQNLKCLK